jgi:hypothetical protein
MNSQKSSTTWRKRRTARIAAGLIGVAIAAAAAGVLPSGAGATNGWGRVIQPTVQPAQSVQTVPKSVVVVTPAPGTQLDGAVTSSNGWG